MNVRVPWCYDPHSGVDHPLTGRLEGTMRRRFLYLGAAAAFILSAAVASAQSLVPTDVGTLGGSKAEVTAVADGFVAGISERSDGSSGAFVWSTATQTMTDIGTGLYPTSVNSHGEVVGGIYREHPSGEGFFLSGSTGRQAGGESISVKSPMTTNGSPMWPC